MTLVCCTIANRSAPVEAVLRDVGAVGYDGVEIWGRDHVGDGRPERCRTIREAAVAAGVEVVTYGSYYRVGNGSDPAERSQALDVAERLGADRLRVWAGATGYEAASDRALERAIEDLQTVTDAAADRGLRVTVERHTGSLTDEREGARRVVGGVDGPCGLTWQPRFDMDASAVHSDAGALADLANAVHLQAVPEPGASERCPLADAYFDVPACLEALWDGGFDGAIAVEFVPEDRQFEAAIAAECDYLSGLVG